jgi:Putative transmembrane protein (PGPGW)
VKDGGFDHTRNALQQEAGTISRYAQEACGHRRLGYPRRVSNGEQGPGIARRALRHARRLIILVVGLTVLAVGAALVVLPGPAVVVIPVGLAILATEFVWAERVLHKLKDGGQWLTDRVGKSKSRPPTPSSTHPTSTSNPEES